MCTSPCHVWLHALTNTLLWRWPVTWLLHYIQCYNITASSLEELIYSACCRAVFLTLGSGVTPVLDILLIFLALNNPELGDLQKGKHWNVHRRGAPSPRLRYPAIQNVFVNVSLWNAVQFSFCLLSQDEILDTITQHKCGYSSLTVEVTLLKVQNSHLVSVLFRKS